MRVPFLHCHCCKCYLQRNKYICALASYKNLPVTTCYSCIVEPNLEAATRSVQ